MKLAKWRCPIPLQISLSYKEIFEHNVPTLTTPPCGAPTSGRCVVQHCQPSDRCDYRRASSDHISLTGKSYWIGAGPWSRSSGGTPA